VGPPCREVPVPKALPPISSWIPSKGTPPPGSTYRAPIEINAPFLEPTFIYLSKFPVNGPPPLQVPQQSLYGERERERPVSRTVFYTSPDNSPFPQSPWQRSTPPCSPTGSLWRENLRLQSQWFIHSFFISVSPKLKSPPMKWGENIWSPSTDSHMDGRPT